MGNPHWWLMALAFVLGLTLTFALMIRRVKCEVPVTTSTGAASADAAARFSRGGSAADSEPPTAKISPADEAPTAEIRVVDRERMTRFPVAGQARTAKIPVVRDAPYGPGSARARVDGSGPSGWLVKANVGSMLYHTPDSPVYDGTIAEIWFMDEQSAVRAGFKPWRRGRGKQGGPWV